jgi:hypothetical protein
MDEDRLTEEEVAGKVADLLKQAPLTNVTQDGPTLLVRVLGQRFRVTVEEQAAA